MVGALADVLFDNRSYVFGLNYPMSEIPIPPLTVYLLSIIQLIFIRKYRLLYKGEQRPMLLLPLKIISLLKALDVWFLFVESYG